MFQHSRLLEIVLNFKNFVIHIKQLADSFMFAPYQLFYKGIIRDVN